MREKATNGKQGLLLHLIKLLPQLFHICPVSNNHYDNKDDDDWVGNNDDVDIDEDILPEDKVNINHDESVNARQGKVEQGCDVEQVVAVPGITVINKWSGFDL